MGEGMRIEFKVEGDDNEETMVFTNDELGNANYIEMFILPGKKTVMIPIDDLKIVSDACQTRRKLEKELE